MPRPTQSSTPVKTGASCLVGTWNLSSLRQQDIFTGYNGFVTVSYKSGTLHYTYNANTFTMHASSLRVGGKGTDGRLYEAVISASGSTSYYISNGAIGYRDFNFAPGTLAAYTDHVLQTTTSGLEWVGTSDTYSCSGNSLRLSGTDTHGHSYVYSFSRVS